MGNWLRGFSRQGRGDLEHKREWFERRQWLVMGLIGVAIILIEIVDHSRLHEVHGRGGLLQDAELWREIVMFGLGIPLLAGLLLSTLTRTLFEREQAVQLLDRQRSFGEALLEAESWKERAARITRFPGEVAVAIQSALTLFEGEQHEPRLAASWLADGATGQLSLFRPEFERCVDCLTASATDEGVRSCLEEKGAPAPSRYCLPLRQGDSLVGILNFSLSPGATLTAWQREALVDVAPTIGQAVEAMRLESSISTSAEAVACERERIARNLHDTLAQNITFLRLKLDELSADAPLREIAALQQEIEQMSQVADEAYAQVRETLLAFHEQEEEELLPALERLVEKTRVRTGLEVQIKLEGDLPALAPRVRHSTVNICREALNNIEKHAPGSRVTVLLRSLPGRLVLEVRDDGPGFDPDQIQWDSCYGIGIMYERAEGIAATLSVHSEPGRGTAVKLSIPVKRAQESGEKELV